MKKKQARRFSSPGSSWCVVAIRSGSNYKKMTIRQKSYLNKIFLLWLCLRLVCYEGMVCWLPIILQTIVNKLQNTFVLYCYCNFVCTFVNFSLLQQYENRINCLPCSTLPYLTSAHRTSSDNVFSLFEDIEAMIFNCTSRGRYT